MAWSVAICALALAAPLPAHAGEVLNAVESRGQLRCGVSDVTGASPRRTPRGGRGGLTPTSAGCWQPRCWAMPTG